MIERLPDFPDGVLAFVCRGRVTKADDDAVLVPAVLNVLNLDPSAIRQARGRRGAFLGTSTCKNGGDENAYETRIFGLGSRGHPTAFDKNNQCLT
jgi:hypothetical protein